jgi:terminal uridylyltransferase
MAGNGLEDQVRNMILTASSPQQSPSVRLPPPSPTVRLPQNGHYVQPNMPPPSRTYPQPQQPPRGRSYGYSHPSHRGQSLQPAHFNQHAPHQGYPNRGRGRGYLQGHPAPQQYSSQYQQQKQQQHVDPNSFSRGGRGGQGAPSIYVSPDQRGASSNFVPSKQRGQLYHPGSQPRSNFAQSQYLDSLVSREIPIVEMSQTERDQKEAFRKELEQICQEVCATDPGRLPKVSIEGFGSFESGFASAGSDMDLVLVVKDSDPTIEYFSPMEYDLPRSLEKRLLQLGIGAHLLTRTRVPIIKVCQTPGTTLLSKLRAEREKWDSLDRDKKYPHLKNDDADEQEEGELSLVEATVASADDSIQVPAEETLGLYVGALSLTEVNPSSDTSSSVGPTDSNSSTQATRGPTDANTSIGNTNESETAQKPKRDPWTRERKAGPLDFPKDGIGIQTDINFFNPLGIHNTQMLRCYSLCDPRVRPMVLFVKSWVKRRKINSSYSGTLSSYGFVLMVLHYLINVANPPVLPNLQLPWRPHDNCTTQGADRAQIEGWEVDFWRRENEIIEAAKHGVLTRNKESLGSLLAGFFQYYSSQGGYPSFHWMGQVLSLRTKGGLITKEEKGWVKAVTEQGAGKQVQHRYLFCIEDPFEQSHNVARTVTHNGIVAIRDEFRRAQRILRAVSDGVALPGHFELFEELVEDGTAQPPDWNPGRTQGTGNRGGRRGGREAGEQQQRLQRQGVPPIQAKSLNVGNTDDFPSLGGPRK